MIRRSRVFNDFEGRLHAFQPRRVEHSLLDSINNRQEQLKLFSLNRIVRHFKDRVIKLGKDDFFASSKVKSQVVFQVVRAEMSEETFADALQNVSVELLSYRFYVIWIR